MPQSGATASRCAGRCLSAASMRGDDIRRLDVSIAEVEHAYDNHLARKLSQDREVEPRLRGLDRYLVHGAAFQFGQK